MAVSWTYVIKVIRKLIRCTILDKIKRVLFGGTFYFGLLKIILQNFFFDTKRLCYRSSFCVLSWGKKSKWTNSYEKHTHKILLMQLNLLLTIGARKMGWKSNSKVQFSKQMFLFHLFCPLFLGMWKMYSIFRVLLLLYSL